MTQQQQGDVLLRQTDDDGEIEVKDGLVTMSGGLETSAYLSLFGGNENDDGRDDNPFKWWGNIDETNPSKQYHSETQNLLQSLPATTANLRRIEDAAKRDLTWMVTDNVATDIKVSAGMPGINRVKLTIEIGADITVEFEENWKASQ